MTMPVNSARNVNCGCSLLLARKAASGSCPIGSSTMLRLVSCWRSLSLFGPVIASLSRASSSENEPLSGAILYRLLPPVLNQGQEKTGAVRNKRQKVISLMTRSRLPHKTAPRYSGREACSAIACPIDIISFAVCRYCITSTSRSIVHHAGLTTWLAHAECRG